MIEEHKDHDAVCVDIVNQISNLGGFQVEFPVYLTCYADKGECMYYISSDKAHVYQFMDEKMKDEIYCLPPVRKSMHSIVSSGQKEEMYQQYKVTAAREFMQEGAGEIARQLAGFAPKPTGEAQELLELLRLGLKGVFDDEKRQLYRGLLDMAYYAKKINGRYYSQTMDWLAVEEAQMEEERIRHAVHEREYSGFAYYKADRTIGYYSNAVYAATLGRREEMMEVGTIVSPVLTKRYCFNDISTIGNVIADFKAVMKAQIDANYMRMVEAIYEADNITDHDIDAAIAQAEDSRDELKARSLKYYKAIWQM